MAILIYNVQFASNKTTKNNNRKGKIDSVVKNVRNNKKPTVENFRANFVTRIVINNPNTQENLSESAASKKTIKTKKQIKFAKKLKKQKIDINDVMQTNITIARENKNQKKITHNIRIGKIDGISLNQSVDTTPHISSKQKKAQKKSKEAWSNFEHYINQPTKNKSLKNAKTIPFFYKEIVISWGDLFEEPQIELKPAKKHRHGRNRRNNNYYYTFTSNPKTENTKNLTETAKNEAEKNVKKAAEKAENTAKKSNNKWLIGLGCAAAVILGYLGYKHSKNNKQKPVTAQ